VGKRRDARIRVVQFLYQWECTPVAERKDVVKRFWKLTGQDPALQRLAQPRIDGVCQQWEKIDQMISETSSNWDLDRIAPVDRAVLRLAIWEMVFCTEVPPVVAINEAIEIARSLSTEKSGQFVNGILDRINRTLSQPGESTL